MMLLNQCHHSLEEAEQCWLRFQRTFVIRRQQTLENVQGRVIVSFVVERDGSLTDIHTVRSVDPALDREAEKVVSKMPRWTPGVQNGQRVRVRYNIPVTFR